MSKTFNTYTGYNGTMRGKEKNTATCISSIIEYDPKVKDKSTQSQAAIYEQQARKITEFNNTGLNLDSRDCVCWVDIINGRHPSKK